MSALSKVRKGEVGGSGVHQGANVQGTGSRKPAPPSIGPKREVDVVSGSKGGKK